MTATSHGYRHRTNEAERASLRALKNWLFAEPAENPLEDQLVQVRLAAAIASVMERAQSDALGGDNAG